MKYNRVQKKTVCGSSGIILDEAIYFHYSGDESEAIRVWLADSSILHIVKCLINSRLKKAEIKESAILTIDAQNSRENEKRERFIAMLKRKEQEDQRCVEKTQSSS